MGSNVAGALSLGGAPVVGFGAPAWIPVAYAASSDVISDRISGRKRRVLERSHSRACDYMETDIQTQVCRDAQELIGNRMRVTAFAGVPRVGAVGRL